MAEQVVGMEGREVEQSRQVPGAGSLPPDFPKSKPKSNARKALKFPRQGWLDLAGRAGGMEGREVGQAGARGRVAGSHQTFQTNSCPCPLSLRLLPLLEMLSFFYF